MHFTNYYSIKSGFRQEKAFFFRKEMFFSEKPLTKGVGIGYNISCHCVKACAWQHEPASETQQKEVQSNAENVSTEEASEKKGAWLQKENEDC